MKLIISRASLRIAALALGQSVELAPLTAVSALVGGLGFAFTGALGAALALGARRGGLLIAVVVLPPSKLTAIDPDKDWFRARGGNNAYLPWWGRRHAGGKVGGCLGGGHGAACQRRGRGAPRAGPGQPPVYQVGLM